MNSPDPAPTPYKPGMTPYETGGVLTHNSEFDQLYGMPVIIEIKSMNELWFELSPTGRMQKIGFFAGHTLDKVYLTKASPKKQLTAMGALERLLFTTSVRKNRIGLLKELGVRQNYWVRTYT